MLALARQKRCKHTVFIGKRLPLKGPTEHLLQSFSIIALDFLRALRQLTRRFHMNGVVEQHQRLKRRVAARALGCAFFAGRRIERR